MATMVSVDDKLLATAHEYAGLTDDSEIVGEALTAFIQREAAKRLASLGGSDPDAQYIPRRRPEF